MAANTTSNAPRPRSNSKPPLSPTPLPQIPASMASGNITWSPPLSPMGKSLAYSEDSFWMIDVGEWDLKNNRRSSRGPIMMPHHQQQPTGRNRTAAQGQLQPRFEGNDSDAVECDLYGLAFLEDEQNNCRRA